MKTKTCDKCEFIAKTSKMLCHCSDDNYQQCDECRNYKEFDRVGDIDLCSKCLAVYLEKLTSIEVHYNNLKDAKINKYKDEFFEGLLAKKKEAVE